MVTILPTIILNLFFCFSIISKNIFVNGPEINCAFFVISLLKNKAFINIIFSILFLIPFIVVVSKYSIPYVLKSWDGLEKSREAGGIPFLYIYKTSLLLFCIPLFFQTISLILRCFLVLSNKKQKIFFKLKN